MLSSICIKKTNLDDEGIETEPEKYKHCYNDTATIYIYSRNVNFKIFKFVVFLYDRKIEIYKCISSKKCYCNNLHNTCACSCSFKNTIMSYASICKKILYSNAHIHYKLEYIKSHDIKMEIKKINEFDILTDIHRTVYEDYYNLCDGGSYIHDTEDITFKLINNDNTIICINGNFVEMNGYLIIFGLYENVEGDKNTYMLFKKYHPYDYSKSLNVFMIYNLNQNISNYLKFDTDKHIHKFKGDKEKHKYNNDNDANNSDNGDVKNINIFQQNPTDNMKGLIMNEFLENERYIKNILYITTAMKKLSRKTKKNMYFPSELFEYIFNNFICNYLHYCGKTFYILN